MLDEGTDIYFLVSGCVMQGHVMHICGDESHYTFEIEGYGNCEGNHIIQSDQIHKRIFLSKEEAEKNKDIEQLYLEGHC